MTDRPAQLRQSQKTWTAKQRADGLVQVRVWVRPEMVALVKSYDAAVARKRKPASPSV